MSTPAQPGLHTLSHYIDRHIGGHDSDVLHDTEGSRVDNVYLIVNPV